MATKVVRTPEFDEWITAWGVETNTHSAPELFDNLDSAIDFIRAGLRGNLERSYAIYDMEMTYGDYLERVDDLTRE